MSKKCESRASDAGGGRPVGVEVAKSHRLALERLQCNNSATLFGQWARGKSGRLEVWRAPGEKGASARRSQWRGGCCVVMALEARWRPVEPD